MAYSAITNAEIDQDSPFTQTLLTKYRDNVIHNAEGIWHPYNRVEPSGTQTGVFYDHAIDGAVATIETPDFVADYDYMVVWDAISASSASTARVEAFRDTTGSYSGTVNLPNISTSASSARFTLFNPAGFARSNFYLENYVASVDATASSTGAVGFLQLVELGTKQTYGKLRFSRSAGNFNGGKMMLLRRKMIWGL